MDRFKMYLRAIENDKQTLEAFIKRNGYFENLGQNEYKNFKNKINACDKLSYAQKADLAGRYTEMLAEL